MKIRHSIVLALTLAASPSARATLAAAQEADAPPRLNWSFSGPFGTYDPRSCNAALKSIARFARTATA